MTCEPGATNVYQTAAAQPRPRRSGFPAAAAAAFACVIPARRDQPISFAPISHSACRTSEASFLRRRASGSIPSLSASASSAVSTAKQPCGWPGARIAQPGPRCVKVGYKNDGTVTAVDYESFGTAGVATGTGTGSFVKSAYGFPCLLYTSDA